IAMNLVWLLALMFLKDGYFCGGVVRNISRRPDAVGIGAMLTFNSVIGKVAKVAIEAAIEDVNSDPDILGGTKLKLTMLDANFSGLLGIVEGTR
ncbi:hypothetical protein U1Q18_011465, partial [Sarracenia purpurea var. burkii]